MAISWVFLGNPHVVCLEGGSLTDRVEGWEETVIAHSAQEM